MSRRSLLVGLAVFAFALLTVGITAGAAPDAAPSAESPRLASDVPARIVEVPNTTNYLSPAATESDRQAYVQGSVDVGSAVSVSASRLDGTHRTLTVENRLESDADSQDRIATVRTVVNRTERDLDRLDSAQAELFEEYNDGTLSEREFLRRLVRIQTQANQARTVLDATRESVEDDPTTTVPTGLDTRIATLRSELAALPAPLTGRVTASLTGQADPLAVYVGGADDDVVLAAADGSDFYRQTTVRGEFDRDRDIDVSAAFRRATELYPWAYSSGPQFNPQIGKAGPGVYRIDAEHPQGTLTAYIGGSTIDVFHEMQWLDAGSVPVYRTVTNETESVNLTATTTTETGPMRVTLTDGAGQPRNATIRISGERVGTTGSDGQLWTVRPSGAFKLTAVTDDDRVTLSQLQFLRPDA